MQKEILHLKFIKGLSLTGWFKASCIYLCIKGFVQKEILHFNFIKGLSLTSCFMWFGRFAAKCFGSQLPLVLSWKSCDFNEVQTNRSTFDVRLFLYQKDSGMGRAEPGKRSRLARWVTLLLGIISILVGVTLVARPFQSLTVLILLVAIGMIASGLSELALRNDSPRSTPETIAGIGWILLGLAVQFWPGLSLQTLALVVSIALIGSGFTRILSGFGGETDYRTAAILLGVCSIILGVVSLSWADITLLVIAVVFGVRMLLFGIAQLIGVLRGAKYDAGAKAAAAPSGFRRYTKTTGAALALILSLVVAAVSVSLNQGPAVADAFYKAPEQVPAEPGMLLRTEPMSRAIPAAARAWRILYTTTRADGVPALASGLVVAPANPPAGPRPVIAWAHGTTGVDQSCAPSLLKDPFKAGATPALDQVIANGWVLIATDYIGLGTKGPHAYLVGQPAARAVLDMVRAARQMPELTIADQTVVWGHSRGGVAGLWAGILAPTYAPDVNLVGIAAVASGANLPGLVSNLDDVAGGSIFASYIIQGYSDTYPDVRFDDYVRPTARILAREMASRCLTEPSVVFSALEALTINKSIWSTDPLTGAFGERLQENVPSGPIQAPVLIGQGLGDTLVLPSAQEAYVKARCDAGGQVDYRAYQGVDHVGVVGPDSPLIPELLQWTQERFDGMPPASTCESIK